MADTPAANLPPQNPTNSAKLPINVDNLPPQQPIYGQTAPRVDSDAQILKPSFIVRGRINTSLPALNMYEVSIGTMGRIVAHYISTSAGSNLFRPSTSQITTLHAGTQVWVALDPENNTNGFILGVAQTSGPLASISRALSLYPQVAGLETDPQNNGAAEQLDAKIGQDAGPALAPNYNPGIGDTVAGDWALTNFDGGGVSVEAFRVWIGGGPMNGVTFFLDEETTRVSGTNYELVTMGEEYEDKLMGRSLVTIRRRVDFPSDALMDNQPNLLEVTGQTYAGDSLFKSVRPLDNTAQIKTNAATHQYQRPALLHEYKGTDGTYVLTSASSITLQKWAGVLTPIEISEARTDPRPTEEVKDFPGVIEDSEAQNDDLEFPSPEKVVPKRPVIDGAQDLSLLAGASVLSRPRSEVNPLQGVANTADFIAGIIGFQSSRAFVNTDMWKIVTGQAMPAFMRKSGGPNPRPIDEVNADPGMWKRVPKFFAMNLNSYGSSKRYYLGRAMISLTDEGGILMQDAWGSQILMSGGNIYLTAEHSIIRNAGRDNTDITGRDHTITAGRHVEAYASGGRAALVAGTQLTLVGGVSGDHGVLIESKGKGSSMLLNGNDTNIAASNNGVVVKSNGAVGVYANGIRFEAKLGAVGIKAKSALLVEAGDMSASLSSTGLWLGNPDDIESAVLLSPYGSAMPLLSITDNLIIYGLSNMLTNTNVRYAYNGNPLAALRSQIGHITPNPIPAGPDSEIYPGFLSSPSYGSDMSEYSMPEPAWAVRIRESSIGTELQKLCVWKLNAVSGSYPNPGKSHWTSHGQWQLATSYKNMGQNYDGTQPSQQIVDTPLSTMLRGI